MNASLDRFCCGFTPTVGVEVGSCEGCGASMYDYELATCHTCGSQVHTDCLEKCEICKRPGCRSCLTQDPDTGERRCEENCERSNAMMDWTAYKKEVSAEKKENQRQSLGVFAEAYALAESHDMVLTQHTDIHFSLIGQKKRGGLWRLNIYPSNQRLWSDPNYRGPFLFVARPWTLLDVVHAAIEAKKEKVTHGS